MKTRCPACQTVFRVTPGQLVARAGRVRCGKCAHVFDAGKTLLADSPEVTATIFPDDPIALSTESGVTAAEKVDERLPSSTPDDAEFLEPLIATQPPTAPAYDPDGGEITEQNEAQSSEPTVAEIPLTVLPSPQATTTSVRTEELILPRETGEIPGYSKWAESALAGTPSAIGVPESANHWPFAVAAGMLVAVLLVQITFHFRGDLAVRFPSMRPSLETMSAALGAALPLPTNAELINIEASDLQADPTDPTRLVLNASLRNSAPYAQAYPQLELTLTDTQDGAIARRTFTANDYLPKAQSADQPFAGNAVQSVRLQLEITALNPSGYRLYVFYR